MAGDSPTGFPSCSKRAHDLRCRLDSGPIAAVRGRVVVGGAGLAGEEQAIVDRRGQRGARLGGADAGMRIGPQRVGIAAPGRRGDRMQPAPEIVAEERRQLIDGKGREGILLLEIAREPSAEMALRVLAVSPTPP